MGKLVTALAVAMLAAAVPAPAAEFGLPLVGGEAESYLRRAEVVEFEAIERGITKPRRALLDDGTVDLCPAICESQDHGVIAKLIDQPGNTVGRLVDRVASFAGKHNIGARCGCQLRLNTLAGLGSIHGLDVAAGNDSLTERLEPGIGQSFLQRRSAEQDQTRAGLPVGREIRRHPQFVEQPHGQCIGFIGNQQHWPSVFGAAEVFRQRESEFAFVHLAEGTCQPEQNRLEQGSTRVEPSARQANHMHGLAESFCQDLSQERLATTRRTDDDCHALTAFHAANDGATRVFGRSGGEVQLRLRK